MNRSGQEYFSHTANKYLSANVGLIYWSWFPA